MKHSDARTATIRRFMSVPPGRQYALHCRPVSARCLYPCRVNFRREAEKWNEIDGNSTFDRFQPSGPPVQVLRKTLADGGAELPEREAVEGEFKHHMHE